MDETVQSTNATSLGDYYSLIKAEHEANNAWSAEQAQKAMDYQTEMSNTAHQREVADLKAAGLNPVLSAGGAGATTGSGIQAARSDENVTALYGLTKMALDASIESSKAVNNVAHYASGSSGYSSGSFDTGSSIGNALVDVAADFLYRKLGIKQETTKNLLNQIDFDNVKDFVSNAFNTTTTYSSTGKLNGYKADSAKTSSFKSGSSAKSVSYKTAEKKIANQLLSALKKSTSKVRSYVK